MKTLKELAQDVIAVQDACNLSGVVHGFSRAMTDLCQHVQGTNERNHHPIVIMWVDKLASLCGTQALTDVACKALDECYKLAEAR